MFMQDLMQDLTTFKKLSNLDNETFHTDKNAVADIAGAGPCNVSIKNPNTIVVSWVCFCEKFCSFRLC